MQRLLLIILFLVITNSLKSQNNDLMWDSMLDTVVSSTESSEIRDAGNKMDSLIRVSSESKNNLHLALVEEIDKNKLSVIAQLEILWIEGVLLNQTGKRGRALERNIRSYKLAKSNNLLEERGLAAKKIAQDYISLGLQEQAIIYALDASQIFTLIDKKDQKVTLLYTIGDIYYRVEDYEDAIDYYEYAYNYARRNGFDWEMRYSSNNLGVAYRKSNNLDSAIYYFRIARRLALNQSDSIAYALACGNIGEILYTRGNIGQAEKLLKIDVRISTNEKNWGSSINALTLLSSIYKDKQDLLGAQELLDSARKMTQYFNPSDSYLANVLKAQSDLAYSKNNFQDAYLLAIRANTIKDSINQREIATNIAAVQTAFENGQALEQVKTLQEINDKKQFQLLTITTVLVIVILFAVIFIYLNQQKKFLNQKLVVNNEKITSQFNELHSQKEEITLLNKSLEEKVLERTAELETSVKDLAQTQHELDTFMYRASHDLRGPLVRLVGLANLMRMETKDAMIIHYLDLLDDTFKQMDAMLRRLMQIHDIMEEDSHFTHIDNLALFIEETKTAAYDYVSNKISIQYKTEINAPLITDAKWLRLIIINLLRNSLIYHNEDEQPLVELYIKVDKKQVLVEVSDNGEGINYNMYDKIFNMFVRASERSIGSGLGLYLVKKSVDKLNGEIFFNSEPFKKTTFSIYIPNQPEASSPQKRVTEDISFILN